VGRGRPVQKSVEEKVDDQAKVQQNTRFNKLNKKKNFRNGLWDKKRGVKEEHFDHAGVLWEMYSYQKWRSHGKKRGVKKKNVEKGSVGADSSQTTEFSPNRRGVTRCQ